MILVLGGTNEARRLVERLSKHKVPVLVSTAYDFSGRFMPRSDSVGPQSESMGSEAIRALINTNGVRIVVDASHPHAQQISEHAQMACDACSIKYIRLERTSNELSSYEKAYYVDTLDEAVTLAGKLGNKIFLTTGKKSAEVVRQQLTDKDCKVYMRIPPDQTTIGLCKNAGFTEDEIITGVGPFSYHDNIQLWRRLGIDVVISKNRPIKAGFPEKLQAAKDLGIAIVVIARPPLIEDSDSTPRDIDNVLDILKRYR